MTHYPVTPRNRAKRVHERARYDHDTVHAVLDAGLMCHIAYVIDGQPYCTPTIHWRDRTRLYWHGSSASRMLRAQKGGVPVCVTVTHLDGLVMARSAFNHSANYRSAMCFGLAEIIEDADEKTRALEALTDRFYPGRRAELRPMTGQEVKATSVIGMTITEASAKVRADGVGDDAEDGHLPVWAGVIPVATMIGAAQPSALMPETPLAPHLQRFAEGRRLDEVMLETQAIYDSEGRA